MDLRDAGQAELSCDKIVVWENGGHNGRTNTADFISGMAKTLPPMMQVMKDIGGIELPESLIRFTEDAAAENGKPAPEIVGTASSKKDS